MSRYPEVASTIECSAKLNFGVLDVFVSAQKVSFNHANCPMLKQPQFRPSQVELSRFLKTPGGVKTVSHPTT